MSSKTLVEGLVYSRYLFYRGNIIITHNIMYSLHLLFGHQSALLVIEPYIQLNVKLAEVK